MKASETESWRRLVGQQSLFTGTDMSLQRLFASDPGRSHNFTLRCDGVFVDVSHNLICSTTVGLLCELARELNMQQRIRALVDGEQINVTERRPALHTALRGMPAAARPGTEQEVAEVLDRMQTFVQDVHQGRWLGYRGERIRDVVNIGIGGSDLGPAMMTDALRPFHNKQVRSHFVSNVDPAHLQNCLAGLDPATTLFIVASKSFSTLETLQNGLQARRWCLHNGCSKAGLSQHFVAITGNTAAAIDFGVNPQHIFPVRDWVGGRFSLWSAIGLSIALATDMEQFRSLLAGARRMDEHFLGTPPEKNIPVMLGLLAVWYRNFWQTGSQVVLPYAQDMHLLPAFLQQLEMESLGKSVDLHGEPLTIASGPVIWGSAGTNGQHSFHQLLHQGTSFIPADFIAVAEPAEGADREQHQHLLANCFSQSLALMQGKTREDALAELLANGAQPAWAETLAAHKQIPGNRPSTMIILDKLDAQNLGSLVAMYEHKVFVQSVIWGINAFDQWGVELGKQMSHPVMNALKGNQQKAAHLGGAGNNWVQHCLELTREYKT
jgi:glucose-6-phosphate isomerase